MRWLVPSCPPLSPRNPYLRTAISDNGRAAADTVRAGQRWSWVQSRRPDHDEARPAKADQGFTFMYGLNRCPRSQGWRSRSSYRGRRCARSSGDPSATARRPAGTTPLIVHGRTVQRFVDLFGEQAVPTTAGVARSKIMIVPCAVNSWLYCSGDMNCIPGCASSARISSAISLPGRTRTTWSGTSGRSVWRPCCAEPVHRRAAPAVPGRERLCVRRTS